METVDLGVLVSAHQRGGGTIEASSASPSFSMSMSARTTNNFSGKSSSSPRDSSMSMSMSAYPSSEDAGLLEGANANSTNGYSIVPIPGFIMKTKRNSNGAKVFINVCEHSDVSALAPSKLGLLKSHSSWPFMISSPGRMEKVGEKGKKGEEEEELLVFDVVLHPSILVMISTDESMSTRDLVSDR